MCIGTFAVYLIIVKSLFVTNYLYGGAKTIKSIRLISKEHIMLLMFARKCVKLRRIA